MEERSNHQPPRKPRVSLACVQCRSRHVRCNAATPVCSRCQNLGVQCTYLKSRRWGKRERGRLSSSVDVIQNAERPSLLPCSTHLLPQRSQLLGFSPIPNPSFTGCSNSNSSGSGSTLTRGEYSTASDNDGTRDSLLDLYYTFFHKAHPCALPSPFLKTILDESHPGMALLLHVIQFIGSLYSPKLPSAPLEDQVKASMTQCQQYEDGYVVQALVLYSTAVYWCDDRPRARELLDVAASKALRLGMNNKSFSYQNASGSPVLAECWRRTWWQLYLTDAQIAAIDHTCSFRTSQKNISCTTELPCEESDYYSGNIPPPRTLEEYDNREFAFNDDLNFSSFTYEIGLVRSIDLVATGIPRDSEETIKELCSKVDAAVAAWTSFSDRSKRRVCSEDGTLDERLIKAHLMIQVQTADMHRRLSTCGYSPIEAVSSCAPPPPAERLPPVYCRDAPIHTAKILQAAAQLTNILTLPVSIAKQTPFAICMIAATTIVHLSACKHVLRNEKLKLARERIRVAMGALETFAEVWAAAKRIVREVKTIAWEILNLGSTPALTNSPESGESNLPAKAGEPQAAFGQAFSNAESYGDFDFPAIETDLDNGLSEMDPDVGIDFPFEITGIS